MATTLAIGAAQVASISKSIGDFKGAQYGMDEVVSSPTLILAGENNQAQSVQITPLEGPNLEGPQSQGIVLNISGNVLHESFVEDNIIPQIREGLRLGENMGV